MGRKPISHGTFKPRFHDELSTREVLDIITKKCKSQIISSAGNGPVVIFLPHAWDNLAASTHYGKWTAENELESQYFLEGYYFKDPSGRTTTVVSHVLTPGSVSRKHTFAQLYEEGGENVYKELEEQEKALAEHGGAGRDSLTGAQLNPMYDRYGPPVRVGFGHTHSNLGVFFSATDKTSVFAPPGEPWVTMVVDPRRCEILVTTGKELEKSQLIIMGVKEKQPDRNQALPQEPVQSKPDQSKKVNFDFSSSALPEIAAMINDFIKNNGLRFDFKINGKFPGRMKLKGSFSKADHKKS